MFNKKVSYLLLVGLEGFAVKASANSPTLEERVLTASDKDLSPLEHDVVRELQVTPNSAEAHALLSQLMRRRYSLESGDLYLLKQAGELAQQAIELNKQAGSGYAALADVFDTMGESDKALAVITEARKLNVPENWHFSYTEARLSADQLATDKALTLLKTTLRFEDAPRHAITPYVVALLQADASGDDLIQKLYAWNKDYPSPIFDLSIAIAYSDSKRFKEARRTYEKILQHDEKSSEAMVNLAVILTKEFKEHKLATQLLEKSLNVKSDMTSSAKSMVLGHLASAYLKLGQLDKAGAMFAKAYSYDPENSSILGFMSRSFREQKAFGPLQRALIDISEETKGTGQLYALLGDAQSEGLAKHDDAIRNYMNAILLEPERSEFYTSMGLAYYRQKNYDKALRVFETATDIDPNDAVARYNQACVLSLLNRQSESINILADALSLDPKLANTAKSDMDFKNLRGLEQFRSLLRSYESNAQEELAH